MSNRKIGDVLELVASEPHDRWAAAEDTFYRQIENIEDNEGVDLGDLESIEYGDYLRSDGQVVKCWKANAVVVAVPETVAA